MYNPKRIDRDVLKCIVWLLRLLFQREAVVNGLPMSHRGTWYKMPSSLRQSNRELVYGLIFAAVSSWHTSHSHHQPTKLLFTAYSYPYYVPGHGMNHVITFPLGKVGECAASLLVTVKWLFQDKCFASQRMVRY